MKSPFKPPFNQPTPSLMETVIVIVLVCTSFSNEGKHVITGNNLLHLLQFVFALSRRRWWIGSVSSIRYCM